MSKVTPIACDLHDHLEIACLYHYDLSVTQRDGSVIRGRAMTTRTAGGKEYLVIADGETTLESAMHEIVHLQVHTPGAKFSALNFDL